MNYYYIANKDLLIVAITSFRIRSEDKERFENNLKEASGIGHVVIIHGSFELIDIKEG